MSIPGLQETPSSLLTLDRFGWESEEPSSVREELGALVYSFGQSKGCVDSAAAERIVSRLRGYDRQRDQRDLNREAHLTLNQCEISPSSMRKIADGVIRLKRFDRVYLLLKKATLNEDIVEQLGRIIKKQHAALCFDLSGCSLTPELLQILMSKLVERKRGFFDHQPLGEVTLIFEDNQLDDESAFLVADALPKVSCDVRLQLADNKIGHKGAGALANAVQEVVNQKMMIDLWENPLPDKTLELLQQAKNDGKMILHEELYAYQDAGFVLGIQAERFERENALINHLRLLDRQGTGFLKAYQTSWIFTFAVGSTHEGVTLILQSVPDNLLDAAVCSDQLANGVIGKKHKLIPDMVIQAANCESMQNSDEEQMFVLTGMAQLRGRISNGNFRLNMDQDQTPFFYADNRLNRIAYDAFRQRQHSSQQPQLQLKTCFGISSVIQGDQQWKKQVKKQMDLEINKRWKQSGYRLQTIDRKAAACASVFTRKQLPFAIVQAAGQKEEIKKLLPDFLQKWVEEIIKKKEELIFS